MNERRNQVITSNSMKQRGMKGEFDKMNQEKIRVNSMIARMITEKKQGEFNDENKKKNR